MCVYREKGQPGLRPGYGKAIENRLSTLETSVEKITQSVEDVLNHVRAVSVPNHSPLQPVDQRATPAISTPVQGEIAASDQLQPGVDESSPAKSVAYYGQPWQPPQSLPEVASFNPTAVNIMERSSPLQSIPGLSTAIDSSLPPRDVLEELVDLFFELVYPWVPMFFKPSFTANMYSPERQLLLHGMVVIAFRFWQKPDPCPEIRDAYVKTSREQILLNTIDACTLISTQALTLLAVDAVGQGQGPRTWNVMSMLVSAAKYLGLSKATSPASVEANTPLVRNEDPDDGLDLSSIEAEEKRRLFWIIYSIDRLSSVSHGQLGGTDTKSIRLPYPVDEKDWGQPVAHEWFQPTGQAKKTHAHGCTNMWHYSIDLLALLDRSNQVLVHPINYSIPAHCQEWQSIFRRFDTTLSTYFENLPREVRESPTTFDPRWTLVHAIFHL